VWGAYILAGLLTDDKRWGMDSEVELLHRTFMRWSFGMLPKSVDKVTLLLEAGRVPMVHGWVKQMLSWYNRVVSRAVDDLVRRCLVESLTLEDGWGTHFLSIMGSILPVFASEVEQCRRVNSNLAMKSLEAKWQGSWPSTEQFDGVPLRSVTVSENIKFITYSKWFRPFNDDKHFSYRYHLVKAAEIRALATFRLSAHCLRIETGRHSRIPRQERTCAHCGAVEDELHIFECDAYKDLQGFGYAPPPEKEGLVRQFMNPGLRADAWKALAQYVMRVYSMHR
jgi:hypothetical protein